MPGHVGPQIPRLLGVIGAGQMGAGIAQVAASKGVPVVLADVAQSALDQGIGIIHKSLAKQVQKQQTTQAEADKTSAHIRTSLSLEVSPEFALPLSQCSVAKHDLCRSSVRLTLLLRL